jgi:hypothetical protein
MSEAMSTVLVYALVLLIGVLIGVFISPKGPGSYSSYCPHCGRYH